MKKLSILLSLLAVLSIGALKGQVSERAIDYYPAMSDVVSTVETEQHLWLVFDFFILQVDLQTNEILQHDYQSLGIRYENDRVPQFYGSWLQQNGDLLFFVGTGWYLRYRNGEMTIVASPSGINPKQVLEEKPDGRLLLVSNAKLYWWTPGTDPTQAEEYLTVLSSDRFQLDNNGRLWTTRNGCGLNYLDDGILWVIYIGNNDCLHRPEIGKDGSVWLGHHGGYIRYWNGDNWIDTVIEGLERGQFQSIRSVGNQQAIYIASGKVFRLTYNGSMIEKEDISSEYNEVITPQLLVHVKDGDDYWLINDNNFELWHHPAQGILRKIGQLRVSPFELKGSFNDRYGRLWVRSKNNVLYTFRGNRWESFRQLFPTAPFGIHHLAFRNRLEPIVAVNYLLPPEGQSLTSVESFGEAYFKNQDGWQLFSSVIDTTAAHQQEYNRLLVDAEERIWAINSDSVDVWYNNHHARIGRDHFFPQAGRFQDILSDSSGLIYLITSDNIITYSGIDYRFIAYNELGVGEVESFAIRIHGFDHRGQLWSSEFNKVAKWKNGQRTAITTEGLEDFPLYLNIEEVVVMENEELWATLFPPDEGVLHFDGQSWRFFSEDTDVLPAEYMRHVMKDEFERVWLASYPGMHCIRNVGQKADAFFTLPTQQPIAIHPNPGCCEYTLNWRQAQAGETNIQLFSLLGRPLREIHRGSYELGDYSLTFQRGNLSRGTYIVQVENEGTLSQLKLIVQ